MLLDLGFVIHHVANRAIDAARRMNGTHLQAAPYLTQSLATRMRAQKRATRAFKAFDLALAFGAGNASFADILIHLGLLLLDGRSAQLEQARGRGVLAAQPFDALAVLPDDDLRGSLVSRRLLFAHLADDAFEDLDVRRIHRLVVLLGGLLLRRKQRHHEVRQQQRAQDDARCQEDQVVTLRERLARRKGERDGHDDGQRDGALRARKRGDQSIAYQLTARARLGASMCALHNEHPQETHAHYQGRYEQH